MLNYMYEKAMAQDSRNGGASTLNNNNGVDNSKKKLLIALDVCCLLLGKCTDRSALLGRVWDDMGNFCTPSLLLKKKQSRSEGNKQNPRFPVAANKSFIVSKSIA